MSGEVQEAVSEFLEATQDWETDSRVRTFVSRLYLSTVGKEPPARVTNFAWIRLRVAYEIMRCRADNIGAKLSEDWAARYEAVKKWDHETYVGLTSDSKINPPWGAEEDGVRTVKQVVKKEGSEGDAPKVKVEKEKTAKKESATIELKSGLNVGRTFCALFEKQAAEAKKPKPNLMTDEEIGDYMMSEFPNGSKNLRNVGGFRRVFNTGKFSCQGDVVPEDLAPVPEKVRKQRVAATPNPDDEDE